ARPRPRRLRLRRRAKDERSRDRARRRSTHVCQRSRAATPSDPESLRRLSPARRSVRWEGGLTGVSALASIASMNPLTLHDYMSFLDFLLRKRRAEIDDIPVAREYASSTLDATLADLEALPAEQFGGTPNAQMLSDVDGIHDAHGEALHYL